MSRAADIADAADYDEQIRVLTETALDAEYVSNADVLNTLKSQVSTTVAEMDEDRR